MKNMEELLLSKAIEDVSLDEEEEKIYQEELKNELDHYFVVDSEKNDDEENERLLSSLKEKPYTIHDKFYHGRAVVEKEHGKKYNIINTKGELISDTWFNRIEHFNGYFACVEMGDHLSYNNFIDRDGHIVFKKWFDGVEYYPKTDLIEVYNKSIDRTAIKRCMMFDLRYGNLYSAITPRVVHPNFIFFPKHHKMVCRNIDMKDITVKKHPLGGYHCSTSLGKSFHLKYQPIKKWNPYYNLCLSKEGKLYLCHEDKESILLGDAYDIHYDDQFLFIKNKVYIIVKDRIYEISDYYNQYLSEKNNITVNEEFYPINGFITRKMFSYQDKDGKLLEIQRDKIQQDEIRKKEILNQKIQLAKDKDDVSNINKDKKILDALKQLKSTIEALNQYTKENGAIPKISIEEGDFFVEVGDHLEIVPFYLDALRFIHLNIFHFENVKIDGIDFRGTDIVFDPQKIYHKNLKGCNFENVSISPFMNFSGVDIRGCKFGGDNETIINSSFKNAIYDETTTYQGVPFYQIFESSNNDKRRLGL